MTPREAAAIAARPAVNESLLRRVLRLGFDDWRSAAQMSLLMCGVALRLQRRDFVALLDSYGLRDNAPAATDAALARAQQLVRWAHRIVPLRQNCLLDSLAAAVWLRRRGFSAPLSIGVKLTGDLMEAHAWLGDCAHSVENFRLLYRVPAAVPTEPAP